MAQSGPRWRGALSRCWHECSVLSFHVSMFIRKDRALCTGCIDSVCRLELVNADFSQLTLLLGEKYELMMGAVESEECAYCIRWARTMISVLFSLLVPPTLNVGISVIPAPAMPKSWHSVTGQRPAVTVMVSSHATVTAGLIWWWLMDDRKVWRRIGTLWALGAGRWRGGSRHRRWHPSCLSDLINECNHGFLLSYRFS